MTLTPNGKAGSGNKPDDNRPRPVYLVRLRRMAQLANELLIHRRLGTPTSGTILELRQLLGPNALEILDLPGDASNTKTDDVQPGTTSSKTASPAPLRPPLRVAKPLHVQRQPSGGLQTPGAGLPPAPQTRRRSVAVAAPQVLSKPLSSLLPTQPPPLNSAPVVNVAGPVLQTPQKVISALLDAANDMTPKKTMPFGWPQTPMTPSPAANSATWGTTLAGLSPMGPSLPNKGKHIRFDSASPPLVAQPAVDKEDQEEEAATLEVDCSLSPVNPLTPAMIEAHEASRRARALRRRYTTLVDGALLSSFGRKAPSPLGPLGPQPGSAVGASSTGGSTTPLPGPSRQLNYKHNPFSVSPTTRKGFPSTPSTSFESKKVKVDKDKQKVVEQVTQIKETPWTRITTTTVATRSGRSTAPSPDIKPEPRMTSSTAISQTTHVTITPKSTVTKPTATKASAPVIVSTSTKPARRSRRLASRPQPAVESQVPPAATQPSVETPSQPDKPRPTGKQTDTPRPTGKQTDTPRPTGSVSTTTATPVEPRPISKGKRKATEQLVPTGRTTRARASRQSVSASPVSQVQPTDMRRSPRAQRAKAGDFF